MPEITSEEAIGWGAELLISSFVGNRSDLLQKNDAEQRRAALDARGRVNAKMPDAPPELQALHFRHEFVQSYAALMVKDIELAFGSGSDSASATDRQEAQRRVVKCLVPEDATLRTDPRDVKVSDFVERHKNPRLAFVLSLGIASVFLQKILKTVERVAPV